jgi:hypothetical protein
MSKGGSPSKAGHFDMSILIHECGFSNHDEVEREMESQHPVQRMAMAEWRSRAQTPRGEMEKQVPDVNPEHKGAINDSNRSFERSTGSAEESIATLLRESREWASESPVVSGEDYFEQGDHGGAAGETDHRRKYGGAPAPPPHQERKQRKTTG